MTFHDLALACCLLSKYLCFHSCFPFCLNVFFPCLVTSHPSENPTPGSPPFWKPPPISLPTGRQPIHRYSFVILDMSLCWVSHCIVIALCVIVTQNGSFFSRQGPHFVFFLYPSPSIAQRWCSDYFREIIISTPQIPSHKRHIVGYIGIGLSGEANRRHQSITALHFFSFHSSQQVPWNHNCTSQGWEISSFIRKIIKKIKNIWSEYGCQRVFVVFANIDSLILFF